MTVASVIQQLRAWIYKLTSIHQNARTAPDDVTADIPIKTASEDLLRRSRFVDRIVQVLIHVHARESVVFAIRGPWGSGKTSLKNLILEKIRKISPDSVLLEFNPWQWSDADAIARALFSQMASKLGGSHSPEATARAKALRKYASVLTAAADPLEKLSGAKDDLSSWVMIIAGLSVSAGIGASLPHWQIAWITAVFLAVALFLKFFGRVLRWFGRDSSNEPLDDIRADIEARLAKLSAPLIVFVDDIDRLESHEIQNLFRQIKVNANLPNIVFVLLFQSTIVENALGPVSGGNGRAYLEKIVQSNFDLPPVSPASLHRVFTEILQERIGDVAVAKNGFDEVRWGNVLIGGIQPYLKNLRDVRRLAGSIVNLIPLHQGDRTFEANIVDFLALETLHVFEPELYAAIPLNKNVLLQMFRHASDRRDDLDKSAMENLVRLGDEDRRKTIESLLKELFPRVSWTIGGSHYGEEWITEWTKAKRVCSPRLFDRYFELQLPDGAVSESEFEEFLESSDSENDLKRLIADFESRGLLQDLASRLDESRELLPKASISILLPAIFDIGDKLSQISNSPFDGGYLNAWRAASWYLRGEENVEQRGKIFLDAMRKSASLAVPATLISIDMDHREKPSESGDARFDDETLALAKTLWVEKLVARSKLPDELLSDNNLVPFLYRWREFTGDTNTVRKWLRHVSATDAALAQIICRFISVGSTHTLGDYVGRKTEHFNRDGIEVFFDLGKLASRVDKMDKNALSPEQSRVVKIFRKSLGDWLTSPAEDERDGRSSKRRKR